MEPWASGGGTEKEKKKKKKEEEEEEKISHMCESIGHQPPLRPLPKKKQKKKKKKNMNACRVTTKLPSVTISPPLHTQEHTPLQDQPS